MNNRHILICVCILKSCISSKSVLHSDISNHLILLGYSISEQEAYIIASKCNISFPQDVVDLMQGYTENPDDIMPSEFDLISNHLDVAMDPETDNGDFPVHTHLVCI